MSTSRIGCDFTSPFHRRHYLPSILSSNCRSVLPKLDEVRSLLLLRGIDIFVASESWLNETHDNYVVSIEGYSCFRADRQNRIGGGVAVWSKYQFPVKRYPCTYNSDFECIILCFSSLRIVLMALYIPPGVSVSSRDYLNDYITFHLDNVLTIHPDHSVIVCGDLNRFNINVICLSFNLVNLNTNATYGDSMLDYILIPDSLSDEYRIELCCPIDKSKTPHSSLLATASSESGTDLCVTKKVFDLRFSFICDFVQNVSEIDWSFIGDNSLSLDNKCFMFHTFLNVAVNESIPVSYVRCTPSDKPWITVIVKDLINKRWDAYRRKDFVLYNHLKAKVKKEIHNAKLIWMKKQRSNDLWKMVNTVRGIDSSKNPLIPLLAHYPSLQTGVDAINNHLSSFFSKSSFEGITLPGQPEWDFNVSVNDIVKMIERIPNRKASADFPTILFKSARYILSNPLCGLINESIKTCCVPQLWKIASVSPIPKKKQSILERYPPDFTFKHSG